MTPRDLCALWAKLLRSGASSSDMLRYLPAIDAALATPRRYPSFRRCDVCPRKHYAHGFCSLHWQQARAGRDPHAEARLPVAPPRQVAVPKGWT